MKQIRAAEFTSATGSLGVRTEIRDWGDLQLGLKPFVNFAIPLLEIIRQGNFAALFSFHPEEITPEFDHIDHSIVGQLVRFAAGAMDVEHFHPEFPATHDRAELYLWGTGKHRATHTIDISSNALQRRDAYLLKHYPSQFYPETHEAWRSIFETINQVKKRNGKKVGREYWTKVR